MDLPLIIVAALNLIGLTIMITIMLKIKDKKVKIEAVRNKKTTIFAMADRERFKIKRLNIDLAGFNMYVVTDNGLGECYLFLESERGQLVGLGNLNDN